MLTTIIMNDDLMLCIPSMHRHLVPFHAVFTIIHLENMPAYTILRNVSNFSKRKTIGLPIQRCGRGVLSFQFQMALVECV